MSISLRLSLLQRFALAGAVLTLLIAIGLALIVQYRLEDTALQQVRVTAQEERSVLNVQLQGANLLRPLTPLQVRDLNRLLQISHAVNYVLALHVWNRTALSRYPPTGQSAHGVASARLLANALLGHAGDRILGQDGAALAIGHVISSRDLQAYLPATNASGQITGAYMLDISLGATDSETASSRRLILFGLALGFSILYVAFYVLVRRTAQTLLQQNTENRRLLQEVDERARDTRMLNTFGQRLNAKDDLQAVISEVLRSASEIFHYPNASMLLMDDQGYMHHQAGTGTLSQVAATTRVALGSGIIGRAAQERRATYVPDVRKERGFAGLSNGSLSQIALPLMVANKVIGVLNVESPVREAFRSRDLQLLYALADQAARAVQNARLVLDREAAQLAALTAMAAAIDARDAYTAGHSRRVRDYSLILARELSYTEQDLVVLDRAAQLHDVGKIGVPDAILSKPSRLTEEERILMEQHPTIGRDLLRDVRFLQPALGLILHHHERWDGQGYPTGLREDEIPLGARVIAVADSLDAMTSDRPYRKGLATTRARDEIARGSGVQFDPKVAAVLLKVIDSGQLVVQRGVDAPSPPLVSTP